MIPNELGSEQSIGDQCYGGEISPHFVCCVHLCMNVSHGDSGILESGKPNGDLSGGEVESSLRMVSWAGGTVGNHMVSEFCFFASSCYFLTAFL